MLLLQAVVMGCQLRGVRLAALSQARSSSVAARPRPVVLWRH
jgi:hypothetical protein